jgi:hypothetical protein
MKIAVPKVETLPFVTREQTAGSVRQKFRKKKYDHLLMAVSTKLCQGREAVTGEKSLPHVHSRTTWRENEAEKQKEQGKKKTKQKTVGQ